MSYINIYVCIISMFWKILRVLRVAREELVSSGLIGDQFGFNQTNDFNFNLLIILNNIISIEILIYF